MNNYCKYVFYLLYEIYNIKVLDAFDQYSGHLANNDFYAFVCRHQRWVAVPVPTDKQECFGLLGKSSDQNDQAFLHGNRSTTKH